MMQNPASLDNMRDIVEPAPVSWWPLAPGWWVIIAVLLAALLVGVIRAWLRWRANAYRRAALTELRAASSDAEVAEILKRTALCGYVRETVAALNGESWCRWLGETSDVDVPAAVQQALTVGIFTDGSTQTTELNEFAMRWINQHRRPTDDRTPKASP